ncbi:MAG TPA: hypothetical protein VJR46_12495 [Candidatus Dormibacteraeota bacterium]|nr:hypothetical protein [Candidatus Dormibacteraeota bacterium]
MTWRFKVQGVLLVVMLLGLIALAAGASWIEGNTSDFFSWI